MVEIYERADIDIDIDIDIGNGIADDLRYHLNR